MKFEIFKNI